MDYCRNGTSAHDIHHRQEPMQPSVGYGGDDVVFYVGKRRQAYHMDAESLIRGSAYFRNRLQHPRLHTSAGPVWPSFVMDCEEGIFESMLLLMRYGTFEALPPMSSAEMYQMKKEADLYGITYVERRANSTRTSSGGGSGSDVMSCTTPTSSGSPKSSINMSTPVTPHRKHICGRHHEGVHLACSTPQMGLAELPGFPLDLADPGRLVLVSCLDVDKAKFFTCDCCSSRTTQWALNFHHRYAFCTACGGAPKMSAKHLAEMFIAAATDEEGTLSANWEVVCDSTCLLRFVRSAGDGADACSGCTILRAAGKDTIWAANCFYSHAFCTWCGAAAMGPVLVSLMLTLRYGGGKPTGKRASRSTFAPAPPNSHYLGYA